MTAINRSRSMRVMVHIHRLEPRLIRVGAGTTASQLLDRLIRQGILPLQNGSWRYQLILARNRAVLPPPGSLQAVGVRTADVLVVGVLLEGDDLAASFGQLEAAFQSHRTGKRSIEAAA